MFKGLCSYAKRNAIRRQGYQIMSSGRLNGIEIARTEWYREGRVPFIL